MAHKKAGGSSRNGRDSKGRRLGLKNTARNGRVYISVAPRPADAAD